MYRIRLLGEQVVGDATGAPLAVPPRAVALVGYLALHAGIPQQRGRIATLFWPDSTDEQALTNLRRELHHLRGALDGESGLAATGRELTWRDTPACRVDLREFVLADDAARAAARAGADDDVVTHATAALAAYGGEFLPGGYDDWLLDARTELESRCVAVCDLLVDALVRAGDTARAVEVARRRVRLRPLDELGHRRLIELLGELGDRAGAVSSYHHCAAILERELGVTPDPATRRPLDLLLARDDDPGPVPAPPDVGGRSGGTSTLVGRGVELGTLRARWRAAAAGRPCAVVVRGDPGVGKTRLVAELAESARLDGAVVATAQCFGAAGRLALAPVAEWLRVPAVRAGWATLDPVWRVEVERLVPAAASRDVGPGGRAVVEAWQRHRFFEGLARALVGTGRPTLLVLDNLHWCDAETLAFLTLCLGLAPDTPVMVVATMRTEASEHEPQVGAWVSRLRATGTLTELFLGPLEGPDSARLASAVAGVAMSAEDVEVLQASTGGFPLYVVEAARRTLENSSPIPVGDLATVLRERLDQVSGQAREVAALAAAIGRDFTLDLVTAAGELDPDTVVRAVDELWRRRILTEVGEGYDFSHDLVRDGAYAQISPPRRWLLHRRVAQGLELVHADDTDAVSAQLAEQYARGGRPERAVRYYRRAAELAARMFAHTEAIRLHDQALAIVRTLPAGPVRSREELAELEALAAPLNARDGYASPRLRETHDRTITLAEGLGDREALLTGLVGLWTSLFVQGEVAASQRTAARALGMIVPGSEPAAAAHFALGTSTLVLGRPADALVFLGRVVEHGNDHRLSIGTRPDVHGRASAAHAHWLLGDDDRAEAEARGSVAVARTADPYNLAVALAYAAITHQLRGAAGELSVAVGELRELCDRYEFAYYREWALVLDGWSRGGEAGVELARRGIRNLSAEGARVRMPYWQSLLADLHAATGRPDEARACLDAAVADGQARDDLWWMPEVLRRRAAHDDGGAAQARLRAAAALARTQGSTALLRRCEDDLASRANAPGTVRS
ncbi:AAA family ATPase [Actinomycetospora sp. TBRC 11914]|uniref:ATP-binding protein n=1 Tax=Actinomycetospora sp. TBRC 11914 TaxID=2729387 RepID=UPI00145D37D8|nr:AAA family ATPase [Actinomycetospora sp. TBRC 11914]NMO88953.1 AAA family ATPase [Actinomycetospora sp. TBRC 11914]